MGIFQNINEWTKYMTRNERRTIHIHYQLLTLIIQLKVKKLHIIHYKANNCNVIFLFFKSSTYVFYFTKNQTLRLSWKSHKHV